MSVRAAAAAIAILLAFGTDRAYAAPAPVGTTTGKFVAGKTPRTYRLFRPASAQPDAPLVVMLHGGFGNGAQAELAYNWDDLAAREGFVVLYPDGIARAWNGGDCCGNPQRMGVDDVAFLTGLIERTVADEHLDARRVYVAGMSNGAIMAHRLACESPFAIAGIAAVSGDLEVPCDRARRTSVIAIHGLDDNHVPFAGGIGSEAFDRTAHRPIGDVVRAWRSVDACGPPDVQTRGSVRDERAACASGTAVELLTVAGAGHQWPGSRPRAKPVDAMLLRLDAPSEALDATATIWAFWRDKRAATDLPR